MRVLAAQLRADAEMPVPAHFVLLRFLMRPRTLTELATLQGVSLPTMSNSVTAMAQHGWVRRTSPMKDRRVVVIEITPGGKAAVKRVTRAAEAHLERILAALDVASHRRLQAGLEVLRRTFDAEPAAADQRANRRRRRRTSA